MQPAFPLQANPYQPQAQATQHILAPARPSLTTAGLPHPHALGIDHRSPVAALAYPRELPLIHDLPNGTSVMLVGPGEPKRAPWTIRDLGPQHQIRPDFNLWSAEMQEREIFDGEHGPYLPYDVYGNAVAVEWDEPQGKYKQIFATEAGWKNPVANGVRMDAPEHGRRPVLADRRLQVERLAAERIVDRERDRERDRDRERQRDADRERDMDREVDGPTSPRRDSRNGLAAAGSNGSGAAGGFTAVNR